jgi:predicted dehydrogenase
MTSSNKIRVGLIGLTSPSATPIGVAWAVSAHLPYLKTSSKYEIVALQNSSAERAAKAIEAYGLNPETVKAYGTPEGTVLQLLLAPYQVA